MRDAAPSVEGCVRFRISTCREQVIKSGEFGTGMVTYPSRLGTGKIPGDLFVSTCPRKVDIRLPGTGNSNSHGARPVHYNHLDD